MSTFLINNTARELKVSRDTVHSIITQYTNWITTKITSCEDPITFSYIGIVELSNNSVSFGLYNRTPFAYQVRAFCYDLDLDLDLVGAVFDQYRKEVLKVLVKERTVTLNRVGVLKISDQDTIRFWSSDQYTRKNTPIRSGVNPTFRKHFNEMYQLV